MGIELDQKERIVLLKNGGHGYLAIANELNLKRDQVRDFCRTRTAVSMGLGTDAKETLANVRKLYECKNCEKEYFKGDSELNSTVYCSAECKRLVANRRKRLTREKKKKICKGCHQEFISVNGSQYCKNECSYTTKRCEQCDTIFRVKRFKAQDTKHCSRKCGMAQQRKSHEDFYQEFAEKHKGRIVPLELYTTGNSYMKVLCLYCNHETVRKAERYITKGKLNGCRNCSRELSTGETLIAEWLKRKRIEFIEQYTFDDLTVEQKLRYDFAITNGDDVQLLIEYDGRQHFEPVEQFGGHAEFVRQQRNDALKNEYAMRNGYKLIRINHKEKERLNEILESIFIS